MAHKLYLFPFEWRYHLQESEFHHGKTEFCYKVDDTLINGFCDFLFDVVNCFIWSNNVLCVMFYRTNVIVLIKGFYVQ